jgi:hypothetical protein
VKNKEAFNQFRPNVSTVTPLGRVDEFDQAKAGGEADD